MTGRGNVEEWVMNSDCMIHKKTDVEGGGSQVLGTHVGNRRSDEVGISVVQDRLSSLS